MAARDARLATSDMARARGPGGGVASRGSGVGGAGGIGLALVGHGLAPRDGALADAQNTPHAGDGGTQHGCFYALNAQ